MKSATFLCSLFSFRRFAPFALCFSVFRLSSAIVLPPGTHLQSLSPAQSVQLGAECGRSTEHFPSRGGRAHPWAVSFMTKGRNRLGGTIISPWHILTAAHGFLRFDTNAFGKLFSATVTSKRYGTNGPLCMGTTAFGNSSTIICAHGPI